MKIFALILICLGISILFFGKQSLKLVEFFASMSKSALVVALLAVLAGFLLADWSQAQYNKKACMAKLFNLSLELEYNIHQGTEVSAA